MKSIIYACLFAVVLARPDYSKVAPNAPVEAILRDDRLYPTATGEYRTDFETEGGIMMSETGAGTGPNGAVEVQGSVDFTFPDGQDYGLTYQADAVNGFQAESDWLPIAPAFPHPIPQFVLDQIAFAARQDQEAARDDNDFSQTVTSNVQEQVDVPEPRAESASVMLDMSLSSDASPGMEELIGGFRSTANDMAAMEAFGEDINLDSQSTEEKEITHLGFKGNVYDVESLVKKSRNNPSEVADIGIITKLMEMMANSYGYGNAAASS